MIVCDQKPREAGPVHRFDVEDKKLAIRAELCRLAEQLGRTPTIQDYKKLQTAGIGVHKITYLYGKWSDAVSDAGLDLNPVQQPPRTAKSESELVDEFVRVCNELGEVPGTHQFRAMAKYSWTPYKTKWGSWAAAKQHILDSYSERFTFDVVPHVTSSEMQVTRRRLTVDCAILHEPVNEMETVALFSVLCPELGYRIRSLRAAFPDGVLEKDGQEILVEFEYMSSNYVQHCHPPVFDGICVCWRRDVDLPGIEVLSIEEYLRSRQREA